MKRTLAWLALVLGSALPALAQMQVSGARVIVSQGGTSAAVTAVPLDSNNAAASASVLSYTANPTALGAAVGNVDTVKVGCLATGSATPNDIYIGNFGRGAQPVVLRGTAQQLVINLNGVTITGGSFDITAEWLEI